MTIKNQIMSMSSDMLNNKTTFTIQITEDLGIAVRTKDTLRIAIDGKFNAIDQLAQDAVDAFIAAHAVALGLA